MKPPPDLVGSCGDALSAAAPKLKVGGAPVPAGVGPKPGDKPFSGGTISPGEPEMRSSAYGAPRVSMTARASTPRARSRLSRPSQLAIRRKRCVLGEAEFTRRPATQRGPTKKS